MNNPSHDDFATTVSIEELDAPLELTVEELLSENQLNSKLDNWLELAS